MKYTVVKRCEFDEKADKIYRALHNANPEDNFGDITSVRNEDIPKCDILFTSSPCQSFSNIGLRDGGEPDSNTKSSLMWNNLRFVKYSNPAVVVWENVASACKGKHKHNFDNYCNAMADLGYTNVWKILNPKNFGTPHNRERLFFVSIRNDLDSSLFSMPTETNEPVDLFERLEEHVDSKYIVPAQVMHGYDNKTSIFRDRFLLKQPGDCGYCLTAKGGRSVITNNYVFNDFDLYNNPPCALNDLHFITENNIAVRSLTPLEYWRLQDIPDEYYYKAKAIGTSDNQMYVRAGNGINVKVCKEVFRSIFNAYPELFKNMTYLTLFTGVGMPEIALNELYKEINVTEANMGGKQYA